MDDGLNLEEGGDLPPPYSASVISPSSAIPVQHSDPRSYSSLFSSHVAGLRSEISASQAARASARDDGDIYLLSIIVPYMEDFISSISEIHPTPRLAEATLIPDAAVSDDWKFNDEDDNRAGEYRTLVRVRISQKKDGDRKKDQWPSEKGSDSNTLGDASLWWESESTARRLAKHLQPQRPASTRDTQTQVVRNRSSKKSSGLLGLFKRSEVDAVPPVTSTAERPGDGVTMTARAEEVTFRKENELGIWETMTGWGIVVRVRIQSS
ncbi:hypothetical protein ACHAQJ_001034 [Trichoderma viride]